MLVVEILILAVLVGGWDVFVNERALNIDDICLRVQAMIIIPSEFVYELEGYDISRGRTPDCRDRENFREDCILFSCGLLPCCCCYAPAAALATLCNQRDKTYAHPTLRIGISMMEWIFLIIWAISIPERSKFLFSFNYGLGVFIVSGICYFIYTQYMYFFPNFSLPNGVSIRSIYGYAFNGELDEIKRLKVPEISAELDIEWDDDNPANSKLPAGIERDSLWGHAFYGELEEFYQKKGGRKTFARHKMYPGMEITPTLLAASNNQKQTVEWMKRNGYNVVSRVFHDIAATMARERITSNFWDLPDSEYGGDGAQQWGTPVFYALSMEQYHVVEYLENEKGARLHKIIFNNQTKFKTMSPEFARDQLGDRYWK